MSIEKNRVVAFHYTLTDGDGNEVENSRDGEPMVYLHGGYRNLLQKLEEAFSGREKGEEFAVTLPPEHAYGIRQEGSAQRIPIKHLLTKPPSSICTTWKAISWQRSPPSSTSPWAP